MVYIKKRSVLTIVSMLFITSLIYGQSKAALYNTGNMSVKGSDDKATLYIQGDMVTDNRSSTPGSNIKVVSGRIVLRGDLRHNAYTDASRTGYTNAFSRDLNNNGVFEFRGNTKQTIYSDSVRSSSTPFSHCPVKNKDYILFPNHVEVNNVNTVEMDAGLAGEMNHAKMTQGVFVLDSKYPGVNDYPASGIPVLPSAPYSTMVAHLKVTGTVSYPYYAMAPSLVTNYDQVGRFQVNLVVNPADGSDDLTSSFGSPYKRMYGMASPYESIRSDYFVFNTVALPDPNGFLGQGNHTLRSPMGTLSAGRGFFVGIDLQGENESAYNSYMDENYPMIKFANRATEKYVFNRFKYMGNPNNMYPSYTSSASVYQAEKLVTDDMKFTLQKGYNYLGNSFSAPLSVKDLVMETGGNVVPGWNVRSGNETAAATRQIMNRVWVSSPNTRAYEVGLVINYYHTYYSIKPEGGTYTGEISDGDEFLIAPYQLFRVYSYSDTPVEMTIPKSKVTHGSSMFLRSGGTERYDDFVFEVIDSISKTSDRVCVLLRKPDVLRAAPVSPEDEKLSFKSESVQIMENGNLMLRSGSLPEQSAMSLLYLKSETGSAVDEKRLSTDISYEDLYMTPSWIPQTIYIRGLRLNTMKNIQQIWLEDKKTGRKTLMTEGAYYRTTSEPTDADNRFRLWFSESEDTSLPDNAIAEKHLHVYYDQLSETVVAGTFGNSDFGSYISVYDIQGKLCCRKEVNEPVMYISKPPVSGVYIVKVSGNKNVCVTKIMVR